jgi:hypothetical protein
MNLSWYLIPGRARLAVFFGYLLGVLLGRPIPLWAVLSPFWAGPMVLGLQLAVVAFSAVVLTLVSYVDELTSGARAWARRNRERKTFGW